MVMHGIHTFFEYVADLIFPSDPATRLSVDGFLDRGQSARCHHITGVVDPSIRALYLYHDPLIKKLIHELKYRKNANAARLFVAALDPVLNDIVAAYRAQSTGPLPVIVPVPLSQQRMRERGYNQMHLLMSALQNNNTSTQLVHHVDVLKRQKHTSPQTQIHDRAERIANVRGIFSVTTPEHIRNMHVILVDDVVTTGATLSEAKRALLDAGAHHVTAIALAH